MGPAKVVSLKYLLEQPDTIYVFCRPVSEVGIPDSEVAIPVSDIQIMNEEAVEIMDSEDEELQRAIDASLQAAVQERYM